MTFVTDSCQWTEADQVSVNSSRNGCEARSMTRVLYKRVLLLRALAAADGNPSHQRSDITEVLAKQLLLWL